MPSRDRESFMTVLDAGLVVVVSVVIGCGVLELFGWINLRSVDERQWSKDA